MINLIEAIRTNAEKDRMAPALIGQRVYLTYPDLLNKIARVSNLFADRRIPRRAKVYLNMTEPNVRLVTLLGCLHYGLIPFLVQDLGNLREDMDYDLVIGSQNLHHPKVRADLSIDAALLNGPGGNATLRDFPELAGDEIMYISTTTGTTGRRKMLVQTYDAVKRSLQQVPSPYQTGDRVMFTIGDITHYGFRISCQLLAAGGAIARKIPNIAEDIALIARYAVNKMVATPIALERMMDLMERDGIRLPSVKSIMITGSLFPPSLIARMERLFTAEISVAYGSSEVGGVSRGVITAEKFAAGYVGEIGYGVKLASAGTPDNPGPIVIVNDRSFISNYYSSGRIIPDTQPFYTLPDTGYVKDGALYLIGRDDEVYNASGNKVAYSQIESAVRGIPGVRDAAVCSGISLGDPMTLLIAVVADGPLDTKAVTAPILKMTGLPRIEKHLKVFAVAEIPRNDMGKVDRQAVLAAYKRESQATASDFPEPVGSA